MVTRALFLAPILALGACEHISKPADTTIVSASVQQTEFDASATFIGERGQAIGSAKLTGGPNGILLRVNIDRGSLSPGWHGIHFHQVGDCSDVGVFKKSGGHVGMIPDGHGLMNPIGPEPGDIPNIYAHADGSAGYEIFTNFATKADLFDDDGTAIVIHANEDDHISQPIGGAGPRIACGVLQGAEAE